MILSWVSPLIICMIVLHAIIKRMGLLVVVLCVL